MQCNSGRFKFDGGAATYVGTALLGFLLTVRTLGIWFPFVMAYWSCYLLSDTSTPVHFMADLAGDSAFPIEADTRNLGWGLKQQEKTSDHG